MELVLQSVDGKQIKEDMAGLLCLGFPVAECDHGFMRRLYVRPYRTRPEKDAAFEAARILSYGKPVMQNATDYERFCEMVQTIESQIVGESFLRRLVYRVLFV